MRNLILMTAIFFLVAGLAPGAPPAGPCALLSKADVEHALGGQVSDPKPNATNAAVCDIKVGDYGVLNLMRQPSTPGVTPDRIMLELKKRKIPVTELAGLGDRSFFASPGYGMTQLNTFKGSNYLIITLMIPGAGEDKQKAAAQKVMSKVLAKL